jgi:hypothetical protein
MLERDDEVQWPRVVVVGEILTVSRSVCACSGGAFDGDEEVGAVLAGACWGSVRGWCACFGRGLYVLVETLDRNSPSTYRF